MEGSPADRVGPLGPDDVDAWLPADRVVRNETMARQVNESIEDGRVNRDETAGFVCECGRLGCNAVVELTLAEYEDVRADPRRFVVMEGHEAGFEAVVVRKPPYAVVAKEGRAGQIAEATDPRAEDA